MVVDSSDNHPCEIALGIVASMRGYAVSPPGQTIDSVSSKPRALEQDRGALDAPVDLAAPDGRQAKRVLSVVVPAYNEQDNISRVYERLVASLGALELDWELIFSVDPCTDRTEDLILELCAEDARVKMLRFSRRFGQPMATIAGLEAARGDAVVVIDCDLQDPPELIPGLVQRWLDGYEVVYAQRRTRPARPSRSASSPPSAIGSSSGSPTLRFRPIPATFA